MIEGRATRQGDWKLIEFVDGDRHLFNLADDVSEEEDLIDVHPERATEMSRLLDVWEKSVDTPDP